VRLYLGERRLALKRREIAQHGGKHTVHLCLRHEFPGLLWGEGAPGGRALPAQRIGTIDEPIGNGAPTPPIQDFT
jgi:hypothetical protein